MTIEGTHGCSLAIEACDDGRHIAVIFKSRTGCVETILLDTNHARAAELAMRAAIVETEARAVGPAR